MNDLVDGSERRDWIPGTSSCSCVRPITVSLACLYGNLLNGCQGLRPKTFDQSLLTMGVDNETPAMLCGKHHQVLVLGVETSP